MPRLVTLNLEGLRVSDHLGDFVPASKHTSLKTLSLRLNGIEPESILYMKYLINFETLEHLNIANNWIRMVGIERLKECFSLFKTLKVLNLSANKLFIESPHRTEDLRDMLVEVRKTLTDLDISENAMRCEDLHILTPAIVLLTKLQRLNISRNPFESEVMLKLFTDLLAFHSENKTEC